MILYVIGGVIVFKAILIFAIVPLLARAMGALYSIGFADDYDRLAWNLSQGLGYRVLPTTALTLMREPGYPVFLAGLFQVFGYGLDVARVANLLLGGLTALSIYQLARRLTDSISVSLIAALLFMLHPGVFTAELRGGVEMLFMLFLTSFAIALDYAVQRGRTRDFFLAGLLLGLATLVRSTALLFPLFIFLFYFLWRKGRPSWLGVSGRVALVYLGAVIVISPWMIRNAQVAGAPWPTGSVQPIAAHAGQYICSHRTLGSKFVDLDVEAAHVRGELARAQGFSFVDGYYQYFYDTEQELAFSRALNRHVLENYRQNPLLVLKCPLLNVFNFWFSGKTWTATAMNGVVQLPYLVFGILGIRMTLRSGMGRRMGIFMLLPLYLMLVHLTVHSQARYSVPLIPFLGIFAAMPLGRALTGVSFFARNEVAAEKKGA